MLATSNIKNKGERVKYKSYYGCIVRTKHNLVSKVGRKYLLKPMMAEGRKSICKLLLLMLCNDSVNHGKFTCIVTTKLLIVVKLMKSWFRSSMFKDKLQSVIATAGVSITQEEILLLVLCHHSRYFHAKGPILHLHTKGRQQLLQQEIMKNKKKRYNSKKI
ncbi:hypothetical protein Cgig2_023220 [Carnegiea gigantea]|uniref:Uncharacterized protein n=1 Tax=Carnegiea gigantea TaxID=171969 RepID=A0A9Q1GXE9_9CARY|nr:hypothetical protein Cgig2_023220 [Carnegiea gigantea]